MLIVWLLDIACESNQPLELLRDALKEPCDFGYYFFNAARCAELVLNHSLSIECAVLLWDVSLLLREQIEGTVSLKLREMHQNVETAVHSTAVVPNVAALPLPVGSLERPVAIGAVERLKRS